MFSYQYTVSICLLTAHWVSPESLLNKPLPAFWAKSVSLFALKPILKHCDIFLNQFLLQQLNFQGIPLNCTSDQAQILPRTSGFWTRRHYFPDRAVWHGDFNSWGRKSPHFQKYIVSIADPSCHGMWLRPFLHTLGRVCKIIEDA